MEIAKEGATDTGRQLSPHAVDVLEDAITLYGLPEIINTDQGS
jgi:hypothetical protein